MKLLELLPFNPIALRMAKTLWSFGHSVCNRVKVYLFILKAKLEIMPKYPLNFQTNACVNRVDPVYTVLQSTLAKVFTVCQYLMYKSTQIDKVYPG